MDARARMGREAMTSRNDYLTELADEIGARLPEDDLATETAFALDYLSRIAAYRTDAPSPGVFTPRFLAALSIIAEGEAGTPTRALTPAAIAWALQEERVTAGPRTISRGMTEDASEDMNDLVERATVAYAGLHLASHGEPSAFMRHLDEQYSLTEQRDHLADLAMRRVSTDPAFATYAPGDVDVAEAIRQCCILGQYMGETDIIGVRLRALAEDGEILPFDLQSPDALAALAAAVEADARRRGLPWKGAASIAGEAFAEALEGAWMGMPSLLDLPALEADQDDADARRRLRQHMAAVLITIMRMVGGVMPGGEPLDVHVAAYGDEPDPPAMDATTLIESLAAEIAAISESVREHAEEERGEDGGGDGMAGRLASMTHAEAAATLLVGDLVRQPADTAEARIRWAAIYGVERSSFPGARRPMAALGMGPTPDATTGGRGRITVAFDGHGSRARWSAIADAAREASRHAPSGFVVMEIVLDGRELVVHASRGTAVTMTRTASASASRATPN